MGRLVVADCVVNVVQHGRDCRSRHKVLRLILHSYPLQIHVGAWREVARYNLLVDLTMLRQLTKEGCKLGLVKLHDRLSRVDAGALG